MCSHNIFPAWVTISIGSETTIYADSARGFFPLKNDAIQFLLQIRCCLKSKPLCGSISTCRLLSQATSLVSTTRATSQLGTPFSRGAPKYGFLAFLPSARSASPTWEIQTQANTRTIERGLTRWIRKFPCFPLPPFASCLALIENTLSIYDAFYF